MDGPGYQWDAVRPVYRDAVGDTANRDWDGAVPHTHYTDRSARNDIAAAHVARDSSTLYFHVRTAAPLSPPTGRNWMWLLVDADANAATGWHGYDFLINRSRAGNHCTVERNVGGVWQWQPVARAALRWAGSDLVIAVPRRALGLAPAHSPLRFDFKWADNLPDAPDILDFYSKGDVAPDARFNYCFAEPH